MTDYRLSDDQERSREPPRLSYFPVGVQPNRQQKPSVEWLRDHYPLSHQDFRPAGWSEKDTASRTTKRNYIALPKVRKLDPRISKGIVHYRNSLGYTQEELANNANIPLNELKDLEKGNCIYRHTSLQKIKVALCVETLKI